MCSIAAATEFCGGATSEVVLIYGPSNFGLVLNWDWIVFQLPDVKTELQKSYKVFLEKATEEVRHMAWVIAVVYSEVSSCPLAECLEHRTEEHICPCCAGSKPARVNVMACLML